MKLSSICGKEDVKSPAPHGRIMTHEFPSSAARLNCFIPKKMKFIRLNILHGGNEVQLHAFFKPTLNGNNDNPYNRQPDFRKKCPGTSSIGYRVGLSSRTDDFEKTKTCCNCRESKENSSVVQAVA
jgi:hypothetical protein